MAQPDILELRAQADAALRSGDHAKAEAMLSDFLGLAPNDIHLLMMHARAADAAGNAEEASRRLEKVKAAHPRNSWPLLELGNLLNRRGAFDEACAAWQAGLALTPGEFHILTALARAHRASTQIDVAREYYRAALIAKPDAAAIWIELAHLENSAGDVPDGLAILEEALAACGESAELAYLKARLLRQSGNEVDALATLKAAGALFPGNDGLRMELAQSLISSGDTPDAHRQLAKISGNRDAPLRLRIDALLLAGQLRRDASDLLGALACFERASLIDPEHVRPLTEAARIWRQRNESDLAEALYKRILSIEPNNITAHLAMTEIAKERGSFHEALAHLDTALIHDPRNTYLIYRRAIALKDLGHPDEARDVLKGIESSQRHYDLAQAALGHMARDARSYEDAVKHFEAAAAAATSPQNYRLDIVNICLLMPDLALAQTWVDTILAHEAHSYQGHIALGRIKRALGEREAALTTFERAKEINPREVRAHVEIATELAALGNMTGAVQALDAALATDPLNHEALLKKAAHLTEDGEIEAALDIYLELRRAYPTFMWSYLAEATLLSRLGATQAALDLLNEAEARCPPGFQVASRRADILCDSGNYVAAHQELLRIRQAHPQESAPWFQHLALALQLGDRSTLAELRASQPPCDAREAARLSTLEAKAAELDWNLDAALSAFREASNANPLNQQSWLDVARVSMLRGDIGGMSEALQRHTALRQPLARKSGTSANMSQSLLGQLRDELRLEPDVLQSLKVLSGPITASVVENLAKTVRDFPDSTGAAIGFAVSLRRSGLFGHTADGQSQTNIPPIIAQFWNDSEIPPDIYRYMESWADLNPDHQIRRFDTTMAAEYLRSHFGSRTADAFFRASHPAQKADILRLGFLAAEGGLYADADDRCIASLSGHLQNDIELFLYQEDHGSFGNNILAAKPTHPVIVTAFENAVEATLRGDLDIIWLSTGPGLLTRSLCSWLAADPGALANRLRSISVRTTQEMRQFAAMHCQAAYKSTNRAWINAAFARRSTKGN